MTNSILAFSTQGGAVDAGGLTFTCCDIYGNVGGDWNPYIVDQLGVNGNFSEDPLFCDMGDGDFTLNGLSPCLPTHSPCGELVGALGQGCGIGISAGACCLEGGRCMVMTQGSCEAQDGLYLGDGTDCEANPCPGTAIEISTWGAVKALFRGNAK